MQQGMKFSRHNGTVRVFEPLDRQYFHKQPETDPGTQEFLYCTLFEGTVSQDFQHLFTTTV